MTESMYSAIRDQIPAKEAARFYGLEFGRNGRAICPWHSDHHPDLKFYENGTCFCFACHAGGDATALTAQIFGLTMGEAAEKLREDFKLKPGAAPRTTDKPTKARRIEERAEADREWAMLCNVVREADERLATFSKETAWDDPQFVRILRARCVADERLNQIEGGWAHDRP